MVFMTMGNYKTADLLRVFLQICDIRNDQIDSKHIFIRKRETTVDHQDLVVALKRRNIHSDLSKSSKRYDLDRTWLSAHSAITASSLIMTAGSVIRSSFLCAVVFLLSYLLSLLLLIVSQSFSSIFPPG